MSRVMRSDYCSDAGFTIIEVLVALAVSAASLAAIGGLIATSLKGVRTIEQRVSLLQAARVITTGLPKRGEFGLDTLNGEIAGHRWRIDVLPFFSDIVGEDSKNTWIPRTVAITVRSASGVVLRIDTVRLVRRREG